MAESGQGCQGGRSDFEPLGGISRSCSAPRCNARAPAYEKWRAPGCGRPKRQEDRPLVHRHVNAVIGEMTTIKVAGDPREPCRSTCVRPRVSKDGLASHGYLALPSTVANSGWGVISEFSTGATAATTVNFASLPCGGPSGTP
jgi:hypothetical protein